MQIKIETSKLTAACLEYFCDAKRYPFPPVKMQMIDYAVEQEVSSLILDEQEFDKISYYLF